MLAGIIDLLLIEELSVQWWSMYYHSSLPSYHPWFLINLCHYQTFPHLMQCFTTLKHWNQIRDSTRHVSVINFQAFITQIYLIPQLNAMKCF